MIRRTSVTTTINDALELFISEKRAKNLADRTVEGYEFQVKQFLKDCDLSIDDEVSCIDKAIILNYTNYLLSKNISHESVNNYLRSIRVFVNWLCANDYISRVKVNMVKGQEERLKFYTEEEIEKLVKKPSNKCSFVEHRTWAVICFILATGARISTVINIKREDLNLNEHYVIYRHLKNKSTQMIPLSTSITKILSEYLRTWSIDGDYIFCDIHGNKATVAAIRGALNNYCTKRDVTPKGIHALRHSFAREWCKHNGNSYQLQRMLTHKSTEMVKRYVNLFAEDIQIEEYAPLEFFVKSNKKVKRA